MGSSYDNQPRIAPAGMTTQESLKELVRGPSLSTIDHSNRGPTTPGTRLVARSSTEPSTLASSSGHAGSSGLGQLSDRGSKEQLPPTPSQARQATLKQWLSYERKADNSAAAVARRNVRRPPMRERSMLSQLNPGDEAGGCASGCLSSLGLRPQPVYMLPSPGEDVCGLCCENKPLLAIQYCGHKTCLLCAKSLCYMLDLNQLALCPFCGSLVSSFGLA